MTQQEQARLFREFADSPANSRGLAHVTQFCPKCHVMIGEYLTKVNAFSEWSYKCADAGDRYYFEKKYPGLKITFIKSIWDGRNCPNKCF